MRVPRELAALPYADALQPNDRDLAEEGEFDLAHFADATFDDVHAPHARFIECAFTSVNLNQGRYRRARFNDVWMHTVRVVGADLAETNWLDSTVVSSMLAGAQMFSSELRRVVFSGCKFNTVNLRGTELHDVRFEDCVLTGVDFAEAKLTNVEFPGSTLENLHLDKATLQKVDLRAAPVIELASGYEALRGAIIGNSQLIQLAPALAHTMGITVRDL